ncbi:putative P2X purinoceptor 5 [Paratrimastix pyriformis]|uniref:P2X purinoceptor 5 n=1 Tax=Paratrimastix pyriformis TaxID=342808 RepID=A0ABQ8UMA4_9EUKA|nr:putative P2X purinoceptor 5 [Paratrimastix pyriformis]
MAKKRGPIKPIARCRIARTRFYNPRLLLWRWLFWAFLLLCVTGYYVWAFVFAHGYQSSDTPQGLTMAKVNYAGFLDPRHQLRHSNTADFDESGRPFWMEDADEDGIVMDAVDLVQPPKESDALFLTIGYQITTNQSRGSCESKPENVTDERCTPDGNGCQPGAPSSWGIQTGACGPNGHCMVRAWCPVEDPAGVIYPVHGLEKMTVFIRSTVRFPRWGVVSDNTRGTDGPTMGANLFTLGDILRAANSSIDEVAGQGCTIACRIEWDCNLDADISQCQPHLAFSRPAFLVDSAYTSLGVASSLPPQGRLMERRDLYRLFGLRLVFITGGVGRHWDLVPILLNVAGGLAFLAIGALVGKPIRNEASGMCLMVMTMMTMIFIPVSFLQRSGHGLASSPSQPPRADPAPAAPQQPEFTTRSPPPAPLPSTPPTSGPLLGTSDPASTPVFPWPPKSPEVIQTASPFEGWCWRRVVGMLPRRGREDGAARWGSNRHPSIGMSHHRGTARNYHRRGSSGGERHEIPLPSPKRSEYLEQPSASASSSHLIYYSITTITAIIAIIAITAITAITTAYILLIALAVVVSIPGGGTVDILLIIALAVVVSIPGGGTVDILLIIVLAVVVSIPGVGTVGILLREVRRMQSLTASECTNSRCPIMAAGARYEYRWHESGGGQVEKLSAPAYCLRLFDTIQRTLSAVGALFRRIFRVYAHIYCSHLSLFQRTGAEEELTSCFCAFYEAACVRNQCSSPCFTLCSSSFLMSAMAAAANCPVHPIQRAGADAGEDCRVVLRWGLT